MAQVGTTVIPKIRGVQVNYLGVLIQSLDQPPYDLSIAIPEAQSWSVPLPFKAPSLAQNLSLPLLTRLRSVSPSMRPSLLSELDWVAEESQRGRRIDGITILRLV